MGLLDLLRQKYQYSLLEPYIYVICLPLLTTHICKKKRGGGNKTYNFSLATCNEASLGHIGILAIGPFN
jgi:uncharacterized membrane protein YiaA